MGIQDQSTVAERMQQQDCRQCDQKGYFGLQRFQIQKHNDSRGCYGVNGIVAHKSQKNACQNHTGAARPGEPFPIHQQPEQKNRIVQEEGRAQHILGGGNREGGMHGEQSEPEQCTHTDTAGNSPFIEI